MQVLETHIVTQLTARIRIQEYGPLVFKKLPTRSSFKKAIKKQEIFIDGKIAETSDWVEINQIIEYKSAQKIRKGFNLKLKILFEDDHLAVIDKPSGYPTSGNYFKTIENALSHNLEPSSQVDALLRPLPVHRLDNPTSGVLIIAKTKASQVHLNRQFEEKSIKKTYHAIVHNTAPEKLQISDYIDGKSAESELETLKCFSRKEKQYSLVKLKPKTGRTHQLRIHCASIDCPIVGDTLYNPSEKENKNLLLHASEVILQHPFTGNQLVISSPYPKRIEKFLSLS